MTGNTSKNRLVKLGYNPLTEIEQRRLFFANKAIPQLFLIGAINALKMLIWEVKSLEKEFPNTLKSMEADLFQLEREYATTAKPKPIAKTKKRNDLPQLPQPAPTSLKFSAKCAECSSVLGAGATVRIYGRKIYGLHCHTGFTKASSKRKKRKYRKKTEKLPPHLLDRPEKGSIRLTTGQQR